MKRISVPLLWRPLLLLSFILFLTGTSAFAAPKLQQQTRLINTDIAQEQQTRTRTRTRTTTSVRTRARATLALTMVKSSSSEDNNGNGNGNGNGNDNNDKMIQQRTYNPLRLMVLKLGFTEPAWTSPWNYQKSRQEDNNNNNNNNDDDNIPTSLGVFTCAFCGYKLFDGTSKYDSGSGWPSFWRSYDNGAVALKREWDGRVECRCGRCQSHLGHVFMDGPPKTETFKTKHKQLFDEIPESDPTNKSRLPRFCINGASLRFDKE